MADLTALAQAIEAGDRALFMENVFCLDGELAAGLFVETDQEILAFFGDVGSLSGDVKSVVMGLHCCAPRAYQAQEIVRSVDGDTLGRARPALLPDHPCAEKGKGRWLNPFWDRNNRCFLILV